MISIKIDTSNDAFADPRDGSVEVARLLRKVARAFDDLELRGSGVATILDINGNKCLTIRFSGLSKKKS